MTVSLSRMSIQYYLSTIALGDGAGKPSNPTDYYTASGDPQGTWFGSGLTGIGISAGATVSKEAAVDLYEKAKNPTTGEPLGAAPIQTSPTPAGAKTASGKTSMKKNREAVSGFDLTFSVPKSISVLWATADPETQKAVRAAHQRAVQNSLGWLEENVIQTRAGHAGIAKVKTQGMIASLFDHFDSRAGDPQLHTHVVLANRVQRASDGAWATLDSYALHKQVVAVSEMYNAHIFDELAVALGTTTEQRAPLASFVQKSTEVNGNDRIELSGIPDELIAEFSQRSLSIELRTDELIAQWKEEHGENISDSTILKLRQEATLQTRDEKAEQKEPLYLRQAQWRDRARDKGYLLDEIVQKTLDNNPDFYDPALFTDTAKEAIAEEVLSRTSLSHPTFTAANLTASTHRLAGNIRFRSLEERNHFTTSIVQTALDKAVSLTPNRYALDDLTQAGLTHKGRSIFNQADEAIFTTEEILSIEDTLMSAATNTSGSYLADSTKARQSLQEHTSEAGHHLAPDQLEAAYNVTTSPAQISAIIGPAGTGKTSTLAGLRTAWEAQYGQGSIIGLAPSAAAASVLGKELGITTDNTTKWLFESVGEGVALRAKRFERITQNMARLEKQLEKDPTSEYLNARLDAERTKYTTLMAEQSKYHIKPGQLLIVDEASMSSTADLHQLYQQVNAAGAKMLLVGDPHQLDAVDAGGFLGWMENQHHSSNLTSVWRFKNDWEKEASLKLRAGETNVLDTYAEHERITITDDVLDASYKAWLEDTRQGKKSVLIAGKNEQVLELNQRAQKDRIASGDVNGDGPAVILRTGHAYAGDTILARKNARKILDSEGDFIKNGTRLTLTHVTESHLNAVREDTGARVAIPLSYAKDSMELGYACTIHRSQGLTVDTAHVGVDESYDREQLYVAMTRGKESNQVYVSDTAQETPESPDNWGIMQAITVEDARQKLEGILKRSNVDKTAHETRDAEHGWANDLSRALSELDYISDISATRRTHEWVRATQNFDPAHYADSALMKNLIRAVKNSDQDFQNLPKDITTVHEATDFFLRHREQDPRELVPTARYLSPDEKEAQQQIQEKISQRVRYLIHTQEDEPWIQEYRGKNPTLLPEIIKYRALADQDEALTALGESPKGSEHRLTRYHQRMQKIMDTHERDLDQLLDIPDHRSVQPVKYYNLENPAQAAEYQRNASMNEAEGIVIDRREELPVMPDTTETKQADMG